MPAPATEPAVVIVAHGQPSAPAGPEADITALAQEVGARLPGWRVRGATLAAPGALDRTLAALGDRPVVVFPHFMADGWFVRKEIPARLQKAGRPDCAVLTPFGLLPGIADLCLEEALAGAATHRLEAGRTTLFLAAHGSPADPRPRAAARRVAEAIGYTGTFGSIVLGFVEEAPLLSDAAAALDHPALCLALFAARNGHVRNDVPSALQCARAPVPLLAPIGTHPSAPDLIAAHLRAHVRLAAA